MRNDIVDFLQSEVKRRCQLPTNLFGMGCYYHIIAVVKNVEILAKQYGADIEIVIIAAWLHDIASITDYSLYDKHHIHGARIADEILQKLNYDKEKIIIVQNCILNHRGSIKCNRLLVEELCVADADAISHFDNLPSLFYLAYVKKELDITEGKQFVKSKLERSYSKLSEKSKDFYRDKFEQLMSILA